MFWSLFREFCIVLNNLSSWSQKVLEVPDLRKSPAWHNHELPSGKLTINENHRIHSSPWFCRAVSLLMLISMVYNGFFGLWLLYMLAFSPGFWHFLVFLLISFFYLMHASTPSTWTQFIQWDFYLPVFLSSFSFIFQFSILGLDFPWDLHLRARMLWWPLLVYSAVSLPLYKVIMTIFCLILNGSGRKAPPSLGYWWHPLSFSLLVLIIDLQW